jgi:hypothetical protein
VVSTALVYLRSELSAEMDFRGPHRDEAAEEHAQQRRQRPVYPLLLHKMTSTNATAIRGISHGRCLALWYCPKSSQRLAGAGSNQERTPTVRLRTIALLMCNVFSPMKATERRHGLQSILFLRFPYHSDVNSSHMIFIDLGRSESLIPSLPMVLCIKFDYKYSGSTVSAGD